MTKTELTTLRIYVPADPRQSSIASGSGVVGHNTDSNGAVVVYYEGNLHGATNLNRFDERLMHAAGRLVHRYPTIAMSAVNADQLVQVGTLTYPEGRITVTNRPLLEAWAGEAVPDGLTQDAQRRLSYQSVRQLRGRPGPAGPGL